jgi:hypothetical protein
VSDSYLRLIPEDPLFVPAEGVAERARDLLQEMVPDAEEVMATMHDDPVFVDAGENTERVACPFCDTDVGDEWWKKAMEDAARSEYRHLQVVTPCCGSRVSLNDLRYEWPAGFARLVLEAWNPNVTRLDEEEVSKLEEVLGAPLRIIWTRY